MDKQDLARRRFGRLTVKEEADPIDGRVAWRCVCDCGTEVVVKAIYLTTGDTTSCGCVKREMDRANLRDAYDEKRVDGVVMPLFKDQTPRKDSSTGYRGVSKYQTRVGKEERYRAKITVNGKTYFKSGFMTAEEAYFNGRLKLEDEHLPKS